MIGTELLQLLQGDPLAQMRQQMGGPNPNPQAPPPLPRQPPTQRALARISGDSLERSGTLAHARRSYAARLAAPPPQGPRQRPPAPRRLHRPCRNLDPRPWPPRARQTWFNCTVA